MNEIKDMKIKKAVEEFGNMVMNLPLAECHKAKIINSVANLIKKCGERRSNE